MDHFNALASVTQNLQTNVLRLQHTVNDIRRNQQTGRPLDDWMLENFQKLSESVERIENRVCGESRASPSKPTSDDSAIKFSVSSESLTKQMPVSDVAVTFFVDNCLEGFQLDKESDSWNDLLQPERKKLRNFFGAIKRAVRLLLSFCDSFPCSLDKETLCRVFSDAETLTRDHLRFEPHKNLTIYLLTQHPKAKELEKAMKLPDNTPDPLRKFFKSE